jgi:hypothetical protein
MASVYFDLMFEKHNFFLSFLRISLSPSIYLSTLTVVVEIKCRFELKLHEIRMKEKKEREREKKIIVRSLSHLTDLFSFYRFHSIIHFNFNFFLSYVLSLSLSLSLSLFLFLLFFTKCQKIKFPTFTFTLFTQKVKIHMPTSIVILPS